ncbi:MAG: hypothetical protein MUE90_14660 [Thermoanaerobaculales bacterium]|nr:hypothetical protein [Thermoanaerobaculales bacterium]
MTPALVVLAAGVGSRYGGLKQLDPVGPGGAALMDYTIYDALRAGFGEVVLVIRRETEDAIRAHLERGAGRRAALRLVHQELDALPPGFAAPAGRVKPWGTAHAVLCAAARIERPFAVANADDFYGRQGLAALAAFLAAPEDAGPPRWAMVGFRLGDTLPATGAVSRGLCRRDGEGWLTGIDEVLAIERADGAARWTDGRGVERREPLDTLVSMNLWGFTSALAPLLERGFRAFLGSGPGPKDEYYLPVAVGEAIAAGAARVAVLPEGRLWCGMTSPADRAATATVLAELVAAGEYPERLWA